jgi:hypothetical protein
MTKAIIASIGTPFFIFISKYFNTDDLLLFAMGVVILTLTVSLDFFTGVSAAKKEGEKVTSGRGTEGIFKFASYIIVLFVLVLMEMVFVQAGVEPYLLSIASYLRIFFLILMILWELHSVGENIERKFGYKPKLFYLLEKLIAFFEKYVMGLFKLLLTRAVKPQPDVSEKPSPTESKDIPEVKVHREDPPVQG